MGGSEFIEEDAEGEHHEELGEPVEGGVVRVLPEPGVLGVLDISVHR